MTEERDPQTLDASPRKRLEPLPKGSIEPFVRADTPEHLQAYWMSVDAWPPHHKSLQWIKQFLLIFIRRVSEEMPVVPLQFLQMATVAGDLRQHFIKTAMDTMPIMGVCSTPHKPLATVPSSEEIEKIKQGKASQPPPEHFVQDYSYWLTRGSDEVQRSHYLGYGGMTILLASRDGQPKTAEPKVPAYVMQHPKMGALLNRFDLKDMVKTSDNMQHEFAPKSKKLYAKAFEDKPIYRGILFALPVWKTQHFLEEPVSDLEDLFSLCSVYIRESPEDKGVLIASGQDIYPILVETMKELGELPPGYLRISE